MSHFLGTSSAQKGQDRCFEIGENRGTIDGIQGVGVRISAGTVVNAGLITSSLGLAMTFDNTYNNNRLVVDPGARFGGNVQGGGGSLQAALELAVGNGSAGTLPGFGTSIVNFDSIVFDQGATWTIAGQPSGLTGVISGFIRGDTIDLTGLSETVSDYAGGTLTLTGDQTVHLDMPGPFTTASFITAPDNGVGTDVFLTVCFIAGTHIATPLGEVRVERLAIGDPVLTQRGGSRRIVWIGSGRVLATRGRRNAATPVIVRKGALADNVPNRDLHVTKGHSLYLDNVLIPVEFLVNHRSILWNDRAQEVSIYHIELETQAVLLANGAPAESYRDDGNRWLFQNVNRGWFLPPQPPCAPVLTGGPVVDATWRRLLARAGPRKPLPLTDDPDLHLLVDGRRVRSIGRQDSMRAFRLRTPPRNVRIRSRAAVPQELGLGRDPRLLGVAVRRIVLASPGRQWAIDADTPSLIDGYHAFEEANGIRWTNGDAAVPQDLIVQVSGPSLLMLYLAGTTQYLDEGTPMSVAGPRHERPRRLH